MSATANVETHPGDVVPGAARDVIEPRRGKAACGKLIQRRGNDGITALGGAHRAGLGLSHPAPRT